MAKTPDDSDSKKTDATTERNELRISLEDRTGPLTPRRSIDDIVRRIGNDTSKNDDEIAR